MADRSPNETVGQRPGPPTVGGEAAGSPLDPAAGDAAPDETSYPALFVAADAASRQGQAGYKRLTTAELGLLVAAAALSALDPLLPEMGEPWERVVAAVSLALALTVRLAGRLRSYDDQWFDGRAVAETAKSAAWRFAMEAAPYGPDATTADATFAATMREARDARPGLTPHLYQMPADGRQITPWMRRTRSLPLAARRDLYLRHRVTDQVGWYAAKARANRRQADRWFWIGLGCQATALVIAIGMVASPGGPDLVGLLATLSVVATTWSQLGRFEELSKSYALAAHELAELRSMVEATEGEDAFGHAVADTESAISREHTMWMAKRG